MVSSIAGIISSGLFRLAPTTAISALTPVLTSSLFWGSLVVFAFTLIIAVLQTSENYRRVTYDPTLVLKYQEQFVAMRERGARRRAARALLDHAADLENIDKKELIPINNVLNLFEDIGFHLRGAQISEEVVHQFFQYWIDGYYKAAEPYIKAVQKKDPSRWEHWKSLYKAVSDVETERVKKFGLCAAQVNLTEFLNGEIGDEPEPSVDSAQILEQLKKLIGLINGS